MMLNDQLNIRGVEKLSTPLFFKDAIWLCPYFLIIFFLLNIHSCSKQDYLVISEPLIVKTGNNLQLSVALVDTIPAPFQKAIHKSLLCSAVFSIRVMYPDVKLPAIIIIRHDITYDIWNRNYQLITFTPDSMDVGYIYNSESVEKFFASLNQFKIPNINLLDATIDVKLVLEVNQLHKMEDLQKLYSESSTISQLMSYSIISGLGRLIDATWDNAPLLSYESQWQSVKIKG